MKIYKGFEALEYVLKNKDIKLYNKKGKELFYNKAKYRLYISGGNQSYYGDDSHIKINDETMDIEWYTENRKKVLIKIYVDEKLSDIETHFIFNVGKNLMRLIAGMEKKYFEKYNRLIEIQYEFFE